MERFQPPAGCQPGWRRETPDVRAANGATASFTCARWYEKELRKAGQVEPTVDRIEIAGFESQEELREWLMKHAPAILDRPA
jgi:hypothetical protein